MAHLSLHLLGSLDVALDGEPVSGFRYDKVRALLAYLVVEVERPHRRAWLAELFWPGLSSRAARGNLRNALAVLRRAIGDRTATPPHLFISHESIQFNAASDHWLDVQEFEGLVSAGLMEEAMTLYQGEFLDGFSLKGSPGFDDWALIVRERLQRRALAALRRLVQLCEQRGELQAASNYVRRQVELEPWQEEAHRDLMRLLTLSGQRSSALAQYGICRRTLKEELDVAPSAATVRLYEQIRDGVIQPAFSLPRDREPELPTFLRGTPVTVEKPVFVARERQLAQLNRCLEAALAGHGTVMFVTGGPGRGKTVLMQEFARRGMAMHPDLLVAMGSCNAFSGAGDPFLPFREVLDQLTGDSEAHWAAGVFTHEHSLRLWHNLPLAAEALVKGGADLIDTFLPGAALSDRAAIYASSASPNDEAHLRRLQELVERRAARPPDPMLQQSALFRQYARVLCEVANQRPILLLIDDLRWIDTGSVGLLFYLGREFANGSCPVMVIGAYRPEEVALGRPSTLPAVAGQRERHPLEEALTEFKRRSGDVWLDLSRVDEAEGRRFVDAFLDTEPNRLEQGFRGALLQRTGGHPLFTIELLRAMREQGDLVKDGAGMWVEGSALNWGRQPAQVEAVIEARIGRLDEELRDLLTVASVEGERFTAQVVAQVLGVPEWDALRGLSELGERHRLVRESEEFQAGGRFLSRYQFAHALFQAYLHDTLSVGERRLLHGQVAMALEALFADRKDAVVAQLAHHYAEAGHREKAIEYSQRAGELAVRKSANVEAIAHCELALELLKTLPDSQERDLKELALQLGLGAPLLATQGYAAPEVGRTYIRATELCRQMGETPLLLMALYSLGTFHATRGELETAREIGEQMLGVAQRAENPVSVAAAQSLLGSTLPHLGEIALGQAYLEQVIAFYDFEQHRSLAFLFGHDLGIHALGWASNFLWALGFPDQAVQRSEAAIELAHKLDHPYALCIALMMSAWGRLNSRDFRAARMLDDRCARLAIEQGYVLWEAGSGCRGRLQSAEGRSEEGAASMLRHMAAEEASGFRWLRPHRLSVLAEIYRQAGQVEKGLAAATEALALVEQTGMCLYEVETHRVKGELLLMKGELHNAEASFLYAVELAQKQGVKSWELRATLSLCRLWQKQGKITQAREMLEGIYGWFTEGFDTLDLQEAGVLLEELAERQ
jgi:DNA-binding SARP family transcriptional activator/predicted ATPase